MQNTLKKIAFQKAKEEGIAKEKIMRIVLINSSHNKHDTDVEIKEVLYKNNEGHNLSCLKRFYLGYSHTNNHYPVIVFYKE